MNKQRLYEVLKAPWTTEKTVEIAEKNRQITFKISSDSNKLEIKKAVEILFNVVVRKVSIINVKGKKKKFKNREGQRSDWKKAIVLLAQGQDINFAEFE